LDRLDLLEASRRDFAAKVVVEQYLYTLASTVLAVSAHMGSEYAKQMGRGLLPSTVDRALDSKS